MITSSCLKLNNLLYVLVKDSCIIFILFFCYWQFTFFLLLSVAQAIDCTDYVWGIGNGARDPMGVDYNPWRTPCYKRSIKFYCKSSSLQRWLYRVTEQLKVIFNYSNIVNTLLYSFNNVLCKKLNANVS